MSSILLGTYEAKTGGDAIGYLTGRFGINQTELAKRLGVSKGRITDVKSGRDEWPSAWTDKANALLNGEETPEEQPMAVPANVNSNSHLGPAAKPMRVKFTKTALVLPDDLTRDEWDDAGEKVAMAEAATQWWIGDLWNSCRWGTKEKEMERLGLNSGSAKHFGVVAKRFPPDRRDERIKFAHYQLLAPRDDADEQLTALLANPMTVAKLRDHLRDTDGVEPKESPRQILERREREHEEEVQRYERTIKDLQEQLELIDPEPPASSLAVLKQRHEDALRKMQSRMDRLQGQVQRLEAENAELREQLEVAA
jgi:transcriptional regulator with XRE-family HTH domain